MLPGTLPDYSLLGAVTLDHIRAASARIAPFIRTTPVLEDLHLSTLLGARLLIKCENLQHIGAFKFRGACSALTNLSPDARAQGVIAYSSGNHAQAVARAAADLAIRAVIVMPTDAPRIKTRGTQEHLSRAPSGSRLVTYDPATQSREAIAADIASREGLTLIPPYDHPDVIAGQGTAALELLTQSGPLDVVFSCCGGGGLLSGTAIACRAANPACEVIGVEPEDGDDATRSFKTGKLALADHPRTIADGARTPYLGRYTLPMVLRHATDMMTVSDRELIQAMRLVMKRLKLVVEPTGVLGLAAALRIARESPQRLRGRTVGIILSGGNVDLDQLPTLLALANT